MCHLEYCGLLLEYIPQVAVEVNIQTLSKLATSNQRIICLWATTEPYDANNAAFRLSRKRGKVIVDRQESEMYSCDLLLVSFYHIIL